MRAYLHKNSKWYVHSCRLINNNKIHPKSSQKDVSIFLFIHMCFIEKGFANAI